MSQSPQLIKQLATKVISMPGFSPGEIERFCWMVIHEHLHGFMPYEYDIREIDEGLYVLLLKEVKHQH